MPPENWGVRSIPEIDSRYPLWEQPNFERDVDEGRFYLPDAEEGKRETIVSSVVDATPLQCLRLHWVDVEPHVLKGHAWHFVQVTLLCWHRARFRLYDSPLAIKFLHPLALESPVARYS